METITIVDVRNKIISFFRQEPIGVSKNKQVVGIDIKFDDIVYFMRKTDRQYTIQENHRMRQEQYIHFCELLIPGIFRKDIRWRVKGDIIQYQLKLKHIFHKDVTL